MRVCLGFLFRFFSVCIGVLKKALPKVQKRRDRKGKPIISQLDGDGGFTGPATRKFFRENGIEVAACFALFAFFLFCVVFCFFACFALGAFLLLCFVLCLLRGTQNSGVLLRARSNGERLERARPAGDGRVFFVWFFFCVCCFVFRLLLCRVHRADRGEPFEAFPQRLRGHAVQQEKVGRARHAVPFLRSFSDFRFISIRLRISHPHRGRGGGAFAVSRTPTGIVRCRGPRWPYGSFGSVFKERPLCFLRAFFAL